MSQISIQIEISDTAVQGFATQKLSRQLGSDSGGILSRIAAANRATFSGDDCSVILQAVVAAVAAAES